MAIVWVNNSGTQASSGTAATTSGALGFGAASIGDTIIVAVATVDPAASNAPTDNATPSSNNYVQLGSVASNTERITFWGCLSSKSSVSSVTSTFSSSKWAVAIVRYTGVASFVQSNTTTNTGSASPATITIPSTPSTGHHIVAAFTNQGTGTWTTNGTNGTLRRNAAGGTSTSPGVAIVDTVTQGTSTCAATISAGPLWAGTVIELSDGNISVPTTGSSIASSIGTSTPSGDAQVSTSGSSMTSSVGTVLVPSDAIVAVTGNSITSTAGNPTVRGDSNAPLTATGQAIAASTGLLSISGDTAFSVAGVQIASAVGTVNVPGDVSVSVIGSAITSASGSVSVLVETIISVIGQDISLSSGSPSLSGDASIMVRGKVLNVSAGSILFFVPSVGAGIIVAQDDTGAPFDVGDVVSVRCTVNSITKRGAGAIVNVTTEEPGLIGQLSATFDVSPQQVHIASHLEREDI